MKEEEYNYEEVKRYPWGIFISCPDLTNKICAVCYECKSQKIKLRKNSQLKLHHKRFHGVKQENEERVSLQSPSSSNKHDTDFSNKTKLSDKNCEYFSNNYDLKLSTNKYNSYFLHEKMNQKEISSQHIPIFI